MNKILNDDIIEDHGKEKKKKKSYILVFIKSLRLKCWETPLDILPGRPK